MAKIDVSRARAETPGCEGVVHLNNAGASLMPSQVVEATIAHLRLEAEIGGYEAADRAHDALEHAYDAAALLIGAHRDEIAMVENATRAWDMAFYAIPLKIGDRILTSTAEYASNFIAYLQVARRTGAVVQVVADDDVGQISIDALRSLMDDRVKLISLTHVPTNGGLVEPAAEVGRVAREYDVPYLLDACQSVGQLPIDVNEIGCDFLSATGRKYLRGPRGTGFLYVRREWIERLEPPLLDLHAAKWVTPDSYVIRADARRFENWESNVAGRLGLGVALDYARAWGVADSYARIRELAGPLRVGLSQLPGASVRDRGAEQCGIVSFTVDGHEPQAIRDALRERAINVSVSVRQYTRLDMESRGLKAVLRASVHYYNTASEIERFLAALGAILASRAG